MKICNVFWLRKFPTYFNKIFSDIEAPSFNTCPSIVIRGTDVGRTMGKLIWNEPTVEDNSGEVITPVQSLNSQKLGSYQSAGTYVISYTASDAEGNKARDCVFKVVIRGEFCDEGLFVYMCQYFLHTQDSDSYLIHVISGVHEETVNWLNWNSCIYGKVTLMISLSNVIVLYCISAYLGISGSLF